MRKAAICPLAFVSLLVGLCLGANAQATPAKQPNQPLVGIALDSNYVRIADYLPALRDSLVKSLPKRHKHLRVVGIDAPSQDVAAAAQKKGCDYLLVLSVSELRGVGVGFSTFQPGRDSRQISPEERRERDELAWVVVNYRLHSLGSEDLDLSGIDHVRYAELPIGWDPSSFESTIFRTVTRVAVSTLNKLPRK